ncbi:MAG: malate dehydrogenase [Chitinispirillaceae bacterium]|nr:malate dehydrogenase [Chitinispirillaceae bacterium]
MDKKVTVIGAGNVGGAVAQRLAEKQLSDVVLVDIVEGLAKGKALDLNQASAIEIHDCHVTGTSGYEETEGSDVVIVTAGLPRKPGMSRDDLLASNAKVMREAAGKAAEVSPGAVFIIVANPMDAMCHVALQASGFPPERIVGMAGILDSARFAWFIAQELSVSVATVRALVLGAHGDAMVPLSRHSTVAGVPVTELLSAERIESLIERTRNGGTEVVGHLKTGGAFYAPASAAVEMAESILKNRRKILPCAAYLTGQYGIHDLFVGVPVKLSSAGVESILEIDLIPSERQALEKSADSVRGLVNALHSIERS